MEQSPTTSNDFATEAPTPGTPGEEGGGGSVVVEEEEATDFVSGNVELSDGLDFGFEIKPLGPTETYTPFSDPMTTSTTPAASSGDTENGYDELLKAYKEVKDQNKTLRKDKKQLAARVEELEAKVRTQEITLRENAEAIDSLSFNNQRLTKRVAAMQSQNAHDPSSGTNGGSGGGSGGGGWFGGLIWSPNTAAASEIKKLKEELAVTKQDLEIKIKENVFMHVQVEDQKEEFDKKIEKLEDAMDTMKAELEAQVAAVTGSLSEQVALTTKTTQERDDYIKLLDQNKEELSQTQKRTKESESKYIQTIEGVKKELHVLREKFKRFVPLDLTVFPDFMALNRRDGDKDLLEAINSKMPAEGFKSVPYKSAIAAESEVKTLKSANTSLESALEGLKQDLARAQEEKRAQSLEHQQQLQKLRDMQIAQLSSATESRKAGDDTGNISVTTKKPIETFNFFDDATPPATRTNSFGTTATPTPSLPGTVLFSPAFSTNNTSSNSNSSALDLLIGISNEQRTEPAKTEAKRSYKMVVTDEETGTQSASLGFSYDDKEREKLLMEHYEQALAQVTKRAQLADRKAAESQLGYSSVQAELANMSAELTASKGECAKTEQALAKAKSDLESTRQNYEGQMIALTEHIGGLNDTVAKLDEEVTRLKGVKIQCGTCHKWNTLGYLLTSGMNGKICGNGNHPTLSFMK